MENFETKFCRFCLSIVRDDTSKLIDGIVREVLDVLLLKMTTEENKCVICNACSAKMFAAFQFKATCTDTEDTIFPYVRATNVAPVDLRDVYLKERGKEYLRDMLEDERICRLCMHVITCGFTSVQEVDIGRLRRYIPEVNFDSTKEPVICKACVDSLNTHTNFLNNFWDIKKETNSAVENLSSIKHKDIEIKIEENCGTPMKHKPASESSTDCVKTANNSMSKSKRKRDGLHDKDLEIKHWNSSEDKVYKRDFCKYESDQIKNLARHRREHKRPEERMYKCDSCDYKTVYKYILTRHQLRHKDISEKQMYHCALCTYKTYIKGYLIRHQLKHKNLKYKCVSCDFKTINKRYLVQHQQRHKGIPAEQMYKCDSCDFKTIYKNSFQRHQQRHEYITEEKMYKCSLCDYKSIHESILTMHQLKHKVYEYACDLCEYRSSRKQNLKQHQLRHKEISEKQMYHCHLCDFKTDRKRTVTQHQLRHGEQKYKCDLCDYKTHYKNYLAEHNLIHKDIPEDQMFKCDTCDYKTRGKFSLKRHQRKHKGISKEQIYDCDSCDFKTKFKYYLTRHHKIKHGNVPEDQMYRCHFCDYKTRVKHILKIHLQRHQNVPKS